MRKTILTTTTLLLLFGLCSCGKQAPVETVEYSFEHEDTFKRAVKTTYSEPHEINNENVEFIVDNQKDLNEINEEFDKYIEENKDNNVYNVDWSFKMEVDNALELDNIDIEALAYAYIQEHIEEINYHSGDMIYYEPTEEENYGNFGYDDYNSGMKYRFLYVATPQNIVYVYATINN